MDSKSELFAHQLGHWLREILVDASARDDLEAIFVFKSYRVVGDQTLLRVEDPDGECKFTIAVFPGWRDYQKPVEHVDPRDVAKIDERDQEKFHFIVNVVERALDRQGGVFIKDSPSQLSIVVDHANDAWNRICELTKTESALPQALTPQQFNESRIGKAFVFYEQTRRDLNEKVFQQVSDEEMSGYRDRHREAREHLMIMLLASISPDTFFAQPATDNDPVEFDERLSDKTTLNPS